MSPDRITFAEDGTLDEICGSRGAHLESLGEDMWFLSFIHEDGTETAMWFCSPDLHLQKPEKRAAMKGESK